MADQLWTRPQVAQFLQISVEVFYRTRHDLEALGLPKPVFGKGKGARWDPDEIKAWLAKRRTLPGAGEAATGTGGVKDWDAELDARAAALAGGRA